MNDRNKENLKLPDYSFEKITDITPGFVRRAGANAVAFDLDNTVTHYGSLRLEPGIDKWLESMRAAGIKLIIVSNTITPRAYWFSKKMDSIPFIAPAFKPSSISLKLASKMLGEAPENILMVGDKVSTDVKAANKIGATSVKIVPLTKRRNTAMPEYAPFMTLSRAD